MPIKRILIGDLSYRFTEYCRQLAPQTNADVCERFRHVLLEFDHHDEFYTEIDLETQKLVWTSGIKKWLGYSDAEQAVELPGDYMLQFVHPFIREWYKIYIDAAMLVFLYQKAQYLSSRITINVPIRKQDGRFLLVKQMIMPFGMDEKGQITSFINSFTIVGDYKGEPLKISFFESNIEMADWIHVFFESLIIPHIRFTPGSAGISKSQLALVDCIRLLKKQGKEINVQNIESIYTHHVDKIRLNSIQISLKRLAARLQELLQPGNFREEKGAQSLREYFPQFANVYQFIDFCDQSGFINLWARTSG